MKQLTPQQTGYVLLALDFLLKHFEECPLQTDNQETNVQHRTQLRTFRKSLPYHTIQVDEHGELWIR